MNVHKPLKCTFLGVITAPIYGSECMYCIIEYVKDVEEQRIEAPIAPIITNGYNCQSKGVKGGSECEAFAFAGEAGTACPPIDR